jgi:hypothetical protein
LTIDVRTPVAAEVLLLILPYLRECSAICPGHCRVHSSIQRKARLTRSCTGDGYGLMHRSSFLLHLLSTEVHDLIFLGISRKLAPITACGKRTCTAVSVLDGKERNGQ